MVKKRTIIIYPHLGEKAGTGHLKRLLPFFYDERFNAYLIHRDRDYSLEVIKNFNLSEERFIKLSEITERDLSIDMVLLDNRESDRYLFGTLKDIAPIVALDEGGDSREYISYLIDILPNLKESSPNYFNPGLLDLPEKVKTTGSLKKILITFGGQDPFDLTTKAVNNLKDNYDITTVIGPLFKKREFGVPKLEGIDSLKDELAGYDLVITSFGITAYEAVAAGVPVALFNPTEYHRKLGVKAGFYILDEKFKINYSKIEKRSLGIDIGKKESLTDYIYNLNVTDPGCPICHRNNNPSIERFKLKSYFDCNHCGITYMYSNREEVNYDKSYFFDDYKKQYGKTYLEDFNNIKEFSSGRVKILSKKLKKDDTILDIGCAYGPFLQGAKEKGFIPYGVDVSQEAIKYIKEELGIEGMVTGFPISKPLEFPSPFNCVTMWYVIEHFKDLDRVLTQVSLLLEKGGIFAFSTPNLGGISGYRNLKSFLKKSPNDHYSLWMVKSAKKVLKDYGFKVYKIRVTGHHPERFGKWAKGFMYKPVMLFSRLFKLGDTFEVYAIKEKQ